MRRAIPAVALALLAVAGPGTAQSCTLLPVSFNELWVGGASWRGGETPVGEVGFEASVAGRVALSGYSGIGGFDVSGNPTSSSVRVGAMTALGRLDACAFVGTSAMTYTFRGRHDVDRGTVADELRHVGLRLEAPLIDAGPFRVAVWAAPHVSRRTWEMQGRRLLVEDGVRVEEVRRIDVTWHVAGESGVSVRWKRLGVAAGVARRPAFGRTLLRFVRVGVAAIRFPRD